MALLSMVTPTLKYLSALRFYSPILGDNLPEPPVDDFSLSHQIKIKRNKLTTAFIVCFILTALSAFIRFCLVLETA